MNYDDLPPLPDPINYQNRDGRERYTSDQMRAYARAALAQPAVKGEPVAWLHPANPSCVTTDPHAYARGVPLYVAPPAPLTLSDERIERVYFTCSSGKMTPTMYEFARAVLAAAQEKP
jgi:hypothetical protein